MTPDRDTLADQYDDNYKGRDIPDEHDTQKDD